MFDKFWTTQADKKKDPIVKKDEKYMPQGEKDILANFNGDVFQIELDKIPGRTTNKYLSALIGKGCLKISQNNTLVLVKKADVEEAIEEGGKEESEEHKPTYKKIEKDIDEDGKLDISLNEFGKDIAEDHIVGEGLGEEYYDEENGINAFEKQLKEKQASAMHPLVETASEWHGGQFSPLYSFSSTGGTVHSEEHREDLIEELEECAELAKEDEVELDKLHGLLDHVIGAEIGARIEGKESFAGKIKSKKAPKKWWDHKVKEVSEGNPSYSDEQVSATVGKIWSDLSEGEKEKHREGEGKKYGSQATADYKYKEPKDPKQKLKNEFFMSPKLTGTPDVELRKKQIKELGPAIEELKKYPEYAKEVKNLEVQKGMMEAGLEGKNFFINASLKDGEIIEIAGLESFKKEGSLFLAQKTGKKITAERMMEYIGDLENVLKKVALEKKQRKISNLPKEEITELDSIDKEIESAIAKKDVAAVDTAFEKMNELNKKYKPMGIFIDVEYPNFNVARKYLQSEGTL